MKLADLPIREVRMPQTTKRGPNADLETLKAAADMQRKKAAQEKQNIARRIAEEERKIAGFEFRIKEARLRIAKMQERLA